MASLDNVEDNLVYYIEMKEINPPNTVLKHEMTLEKIIKIIRSPELYKTHEYLKDNYVFDKNNFKTQITESYILKNEEAQKMGIFMQWKTNYEILINQTIFPLDGLNYYFINYVNKTATDVSYNHFIVVVCLDISKEPETFSAYHSNPDDYELKCTLSNGLTFSNVFTV